MHRAIFHKLDVQGRNLSFEDDLTVLIVAHGATENAFREAFNSSTVDARIEYATDLARRYSVTRNPTAVVNGRYLSDTRMAESASDLIGLLDAIAETQVNDH